MADDERPAAPGTIPTPAAPEPSRFTTQGPPSPARSRRRWWRYLAWAIPLVVVILGGLALGGYVYLLAQAAIGPADAARRPQARLFAWPFRLVDRVNVLVIGVDVTLDNRRRILNVSRADSLLLVSVDPKRRRIAALSIPRDTRAFIPGIGEAKINASYAYGGPRLTIRTVEHLLAVKVHYYVKLGPHSFGQLIDAIGGLDVDVEKDMKYTDSWAGYSINLKKGRQHLNGDQVTGYIRFRHDEMGDIGRVERQRKVMNTLVRQLRRPETILHAPGLLRAFARNTQTDLGAVELITLGLFALRAKDAPLVEHTLPGGFAPMYWEPDFGRIRPLIADLFYGLSADELAATPVEVRSPPGQSALAWRAAARLHEVGFRNVQLSARPAAAEVTTVVSRTPESAAARLIAAALGRAVLRHDPGAPGAPITVVAVREPSGRAQGTVPGRNGSQ